MRRIEIDEDVYEALAQHAVGFDTPNDVLRRMLLADGTAGGPAVTASPTHGKSTIPGALSTLIEGGAVKPGDGLLHVQVRKGRTVRGVVEADGWVRTDIDRYKAPSPALGALVGTSIDGWANWIHESSGKSLRTLRDENERRR